MGGGGEFWGCCRKDGTYRGLEDALVAPVGVGRLLHFLLGSVGVDDAILAGNLLAVALLILLLLAQEPLDRLLEVVVEAFELALLKAEAAVRRALRVGLELLDLAADRRVLHLCLRHQGLELPLRRAVAAGERLLVQRGNVLDVGGQTADLLADRRHPREELGLREHVAALGPRRTVLPLGLRRAIVILRLWRPVLRLLGPR